MSLLVCALLIIGLWRQPSSLNVFETKSTDDDSPNELSIYSTESYQTQEIRSVATRPHRRFGSLHAKSLEGVVETKLQLCWQRVVVERCDARCRICESWVLNEDGSVAEGFSAEDCDLIYGDTLDRRGLEWFSDMSALQGKAVRLFPYERSRSLSLKWEE